MKIAIFLIFMFAAFHGIVYAASTNQTKISQVLYNGNSDYTFFVSETGWIVKDSNGNILCQPYYIQITNGVQGKDKILSIGLAAKMAGAAISFDGECSSDPSYFNAYYVRLY